MALSALAAHKLRSGLTLLGVLIGVFSIIVVMTTMRALKSDIEREMSELGPDVRRAEVAGNLFRRFGGLREILATQEYHARHGPGGAGEGDTGQQRGHRGQLLGRSN